MEFNKEASIASKGLAVLMMILFHLLAFPERNGEYIDMQSMGHPILKAMQFCIPIYVFIAGYANELIVRKYAHKAYGTILNNCKKLYFRFLLIAICLLSITTLFRLLPIQSYGNECLIYNDLHNLSTGGVKG